MKGLRYNRPLLTAYTVVGIAVSMLGVSFAAVPLYDLFCRVTGFAGTTQVANAASMQLGERQYKINLHAQTADSLDWDFKSLQKSITVTSGENALVSYYAKNMAREKTTGYSVFGVTPSGAGEYVQKYECFCFTNQSLASGEGTEMPVSFFIDPAIEQDPDLASTQTITLYYTFYPAKGS